MHISCLKIKNMYNMPMLFWIVHKGLSDPRKLWGPNFKTLIRAPTSKTYWWQPNRNNSTCKRSQVGVSYFSAPWHIVCIRIYDAENGIDSRIEDYGDSWLNYCRGRFIWKVTVPTNVNINSGPVRLWWVPCLTKDTN